MSVTIKKLYTIAVKAGRGKLVVPLMVALLVVVAGLLLAFVPQINKTDTTEADGVLRYTEDVPSEEPVPDDYAVADNEPLSIEITRVGIKGYMQKVGVDQHQAIAAPNNVSLAGWFVDSVRPGEKGLSIIDGHVSGRSKDGIFKNLSQAQAGDEIVVTMGNGQKFTYKVSEVETVPNDQAASALFEQNPQAASQLNLITCGGAYDQQSRQYEQRVIVTSVLIDSSEDR